MVIEFINFNKLKQPLRIGFGFSEFLQNLGQSSTKYSNWITKLVDTMQSIDQCLRLFG